MKRRNCAPFRSHVSITAAFSMVLLAHFAAPSASAITYYWDNDGTTAGFGTAAGTWADPTTGDATQGWSTDATGATLPVNVTTTTADTANFGTATALAAGTVNVGTVNVGTMNFGSASGAINLSGGTISLDVSRIITAQNNGTIIGSNLSFGGNGTISFSRPTSVAGTLTINGLIGGSGTMTFTTPNVGSGGNTQVIALGAANTWTGNTTITTANTGNTTIIRAGVNDALPTTTVLNLNGGNGSGSGRTVTFDLNGKNQTLAGLTNSISTLTARNQRVSSTAAATLTINNTSNYTFGGAGISSTFNGNPVNPTAQITGAVSIVKTAAGTFTLLGSQSYTGATTVNAGKLVGVVGGHHQNSDVTLSNATATYGVSITDNTKKWTCKSLATTAAGTLEFNFGDVAPSSSVSPLTITNAADFSTTPLVSVVVTASVAPGIYPLMTWGSTSGTAPTTANLTVSQLPYGSTAELQVSGNTLNLVITSNLTYAVKANNTDNLNLGSSWVGGTAPGPTALAKWNNTVTSANSTVLGADLTWPGMVIENPTGSVTIGAGNTLTLGAADTDIDMSQATADLTLNCPLTLGDTNSWNVADTRTLTLGGQVSGAFAVTKLGAGTAILSSAANNYTGNTTVSAGTLQLGANDVIPSGASTGNVSVAGTLDLNGKSDTINGLSGAGTIDNVAATTTSNLTVGGNDQTSIFSGVLQNTGSTAALNLTKTGTGALTLSGANNFTGTTSVTGGALILGHASALGGTTGITLADGTSLTPGISGINISAPITLGSTGTTATITAPNVAGSGTTNFPVTLSGGISGDGNVNFSGVSPTNAYGVINLNTASSYAGSTLITTVSAYGGGVPNNAMIFVNLGVTNALPVTTVLTLDGGDGGGSAPGRFCELDLNGNDQTLAGLTNVTGRVSRVQRIVNNSATAATLTVNNGIDYTYSGQLGWVSGYGSSAYNNFGLGKSGSAKFTLSGVCTYTGATTVTGGTLALGASNVLANTTAVSIGGGTLAVGAGFTDTVGTLAVTSAATIDIGSITTALACADSSAVAWAGPLTLTGPFVSGASLRFGDGTGTGLTPAQLASISASGFTGFALNGSGYLTATSTGGFSSWITGTFVNGTVPGDKQGPNDDFDNDGISNLVEYALAGEDPTVPKASIGTFAANVLSFTKRAGTSGLIYAIQESTDLGVADDWTEVTGGSYVNDTTTISYTLTPGTPVKNFTRLKVLSY